MGIVIKILLPKRVPLGQGCNAPSRNGQKLSDQFERIPAALFKEKSVALWGKQTRFRRAIPLSQTSRPTAVVALGFFARAPA